jgi:medium-chain acyl-[acyl-carrier-protein] hydrolase
LSRAISREITPFLDKPSIFYGHSMGALVGFETARSLRHSGAPLPLMMLLAAYPPPHAALARTPMPPLSDKEFIEKLRRWQGLSESVLQNAELMEFLLPVLRADFEACDTYEYSPEVPLDCPLIMYGGSEDQAVALEDLQAWSTHTSKSFSVSMLPGNHFFIQSHRTLLLERIENDVRALSL